MRLRVLTLLLLLPALLHAQKVKPAPPVPYTSFENERLTLYAWPGSKTAVLTASPTLEPETMQKLLSATDRAYQFFADQTGRLPAPGPNFKGLASIAEVPKTCGPGCANLGSTGIEITPQSMLFLYFGIRNVNRYDQVVFYELGRNFWFLNPQLNYKESINEPCINTGFAVLMRDQALHALHLQGALQGSAEDYDEQQARTEHLLDRYLADPTLTWANTLGAGKSPDLACPDLFASFVLRLMRDHGGLKFLAALWHEAAQRPSATTTQDAVDNFTLAASAAAHQNLTDQFAQWRWPTSDAALAEANQLYPTR